MKAIVQVSRFARGTQGEVAPEWKGERTIHWRRVLRSYPTTAHPPAYYDSKVPFIRYGGGFYEVRPLPEHDGHDFYAQQRRDGVQFVCALAERDLDEAMKKSARARAGR